MASKSSAPSPDPTHLQEMARFREVITGMAPPNGLEGCIECLTSRTGHKPRLTTLETAPALTALYLNQAGALGHTEEVVLNHEVEGSREQNPRWRQHAVKTAGTTKEALVGKIAATFEGAEVINIHDVLHQTPDPFSIIKAAYEALPQGGYGVVVEPFYTGGAGSIQHTQRERHTPYPDSLLHMSEHELWVNWIRCQGGEISHAKLLPGTVAWKSGLFFVLIVVFQKGEQEEAPFIIPKPKDLNPHLSIRENASTIFDVWPLNHLSEEERKQIEEALGQINPMAMEMLQEETPNKLVRSLLHELIPKSTFEDWRRALPGVQVSNDQLIGMQINKHFYASYMLKMTDQKYMGDDTELSSRVTRFCEAMFLVHILKNLFGIDLSQWIVHERDWVQNAIWTFAENAEDPHEVMTYPNFSAGVRAFLKAVFNQ